MNGLSPQLLIATASAFVGLGEHVTDHVAGGLMDRLCSTLQSIAGKPS